MSNNMKIMVELDGGVFDSAAIDVLRAQIKNIARSEVDKIIYATVQETIEARFTPANIEEIVRKGFDNYSHHFNNPMKQVIRDETQKWLNNYTKSNKNFIPEIIRSTVQQDTEQCKQFIEEIVRKVLRNA